MATILAHIKVHDGAASRFETIARGLFHASHESEPRLRSYEYWRAAEANTYYALLAFDDYLAFLDHQTSSHHEAAAPSLRECIASIRLEWVDPVTGASNHAPSNPQDLPSEATQVACDYAEKFGVHVPPWWPELRAQ